MSENPHEAVDQLFKKNQSTEVISRLNHGENIQDIINTEFNPEQNFSPEEIECSDGRCPHHGKEISVAGSGILLSEEEFDMMMKKYPDIKVITTHADCGAGKLAFANAQKNETVPPGITTAEEFAADWAKKMAAKYNLSYRHIGVDEFVAPYHHEQGIMVDTTGKIHQKMVNGMSNMFASHTASFAHPDNVIAEVQVLTNIGLGDHGLGQRITDEKPFYIMVACADTQKAEQMHEAFSTALKDHGDNVQIKTFVVPN